MASSDPSVSSERTGVFARIRQGLKRTSDVLRTDIRDLVNRKQGQLVDDWLDELYAILIKTDMGVGPAREIREFVASEFRGRVVTFEELAHAVQQKFAQLLGEARPEIHFAEQGPTVILVVGVNGSGKTTSIAKLAHRFKHQGRRVVLGAGDTFRAAAVKQLKLWADRLGVDIIEGQAGGDPASVAHRTVSRAFELGADVCIIDTAGRLQTQANLMDQLKKIHRVIQKLVPEAPHEVLLVLDATAGQNGLSQAEGFSQAAGCTGIVLAKLDGSAKGGVIIPICQRFQLPVKFVGVGEQMEDLVEFQTTDFVAGLFAPPKSF
jgi:fused signal recognition particle receptor